MQGLPRTVGQHHITGLDMIAILPRLHFAVHCMGGVFVFEERDSCSSHVVVEVIDIIHK